MIDLPPHRNDPLTHRTGFVISAPASGQGKTTVTLGLLRALKQAGLDVVSAKAGPDFIDPAFHAAATGRECATLDAWAMDEATLRARVPPAGLLVVEGAMGLFDGAAGGDREGQGATAAVARTLGLPVILVIDGSKAAQSVGAVVAGLAAWSDVAIAGVILNRVGSSRHEEMLRGAIEPFRPVLGAIPKDDALHTPSRHLGLIQAGERSDLEEFISHAAEVIADNCDLAQIADLAAPVLSGGTPRRLPPLGARIAVAQDTAFAFAYPHMLADWRAQGVQIMTFSPLAGDVPDAAADAVFLPGGYPELHAGKLSTNGFLDGLREAAANDMLIYGECGGYMVLGRGLVDADGRRHAMSGLLPLETSFAERKLHLGYRALGGGAGPLAGDFKGHEFHYATTLKAKGEPLFTAADAQGTSLDPMGLRQGRVMGSFAHIVAVG